MARIHYYGQWLGYCTVAIDLDAVLLQVAEKQRLGYSTVDSG